MEIIEREIALKMDLKTYYTGKICKRGHLAYRYTSSGTCSECVNGSKNIDLRKAGLSESEREFENRTRGANDAETMETAARLRAERDAAIAAAQAVAVEQTRLKAERDAALPHIAMDRFLICDDADWMTVRSLVLMETRAVFPALTDEDIAPLQGTKRLGGPVSRHTVHTTQELWETLKAMCNAMLKKRQPVDRLVVNHGRLVRTDLRRWFALIGNEIRSLGPEADSVEYRPRDKDIEEAVMLGGQWYRPYEVAAVMRYQREAGEPIQ